MGRVATLAARAAMAAEVAGAAGAAARAQGAQRAGGPWAAALLALAVAAPLAGCAQCAPLLDVRHCLPEQPACFPDVDDRVVDWDAALAAGWPDVDALLRDVPAGEHGHAQWTAERARAFWEQVGTDPDAQRKQVFVQVHPDAWSRIRVLEC